MRVSSLQADGFGRFVLSSYIRDSRCPGYVRQGKFLAHERKAGLARVVPCAAEIVRCCPYGTLNAFCQHV